MSCERPISDTYYTLSWEAVSPKKASQCRGILETTGTGDIKQEQLSECGNQVFGPMALDLL
jgi:hypothetical protein